MLDLYTAYSKVIRRLFGILARAHNSIVIKLAGDLVLRLDCRIAKFIFNIVSHGNDIVRFITRIKFANPRSIIG